MSSNIVKMKNIVELYSDSGIYIGQQISQFETDLAISNFYYLNFYVEDALRDLKCIFDNSYFQKELYLDDTKKSLVHYYHHIVNSFFSNIGFIKDYIDLLNKREFTKGMIDVKLDAVPRHKIHHFDEDSLKLRNNGHIIHGLNVVIDEEDVHLREVKDINRLLDVIDYKYYYLREENDLRIVDLIEIRTTLEDLKKKVDNIQYFIKRCWISWH